MTAHCIWARRVTSLQRFLRPVTPRGAAGHPVLYGAARLQCSLAGCAVVVGRRAMATGLLRRRSLVVQRHRMGYPLSGLATLDAPHRSRHAHRRSRWLVYRLRQRGRRPRSRSPTEARAGLVRSGRHHDDGAMAYRHRPPHSRTNPTVAGSAGTETVIRSGPRLIALICRGYDRSRLDRGLSTLTLAALAAVDVGVVDERSGDLVAVLAHGDYSVDLKRVMTT
jgi:hypothetical protein